MGRYDLAPKDKQPIVEEALCAFLNSNYEEAIKIALEYLKKCGRGPISVGVGLKMGGPPPARYLGYLSTVRPTILSSIPVELLEELRRETALEELFCEEDRRKWRAEEKFVPFERRFAKNMFRFAASIQYNLWCYRLGGIKKVEIRCLEHACAVCTPLHGKTYAIDDVPELPNPSCTGEDGCRCMLFPIFEK